MKRPFLNAQFYETYYFAFSVRNILHDQIAYIRHLDEFYGDDKYLDFTKPFPRYSAFHSFLEFVIGSILTDGTENVDLAERRLQLERFACIPSALEDMKPSVLPVEHALSHHRIAYIPFGKWLAEKGSTFDDADEDDICEYIAHLWESSALETLLLQTVKEVFYLLFGNRQLLMLFNDMLANQVRDTVLTELPQECAKYFERDGVLKRVHLPRWVQRAVFYRDRGLCTACQADLTGIVNVWGEDHFDHIVPLAQGGLNDITNIQLLCGRCNLKKHDAHAATSTEYEDWYPIDEQ